MTGYVNRKYNLCHILRHIVCSTLGFFRIKDHYFWQVLRFNLLPLYSLKITQHSRNEKSILYITPLYDVFEVYRLHVCVIKSKRSEDKLM